MPVIATAMAKGTIVAMLNVERCRALARAANQAGLWPGIRLVHPISSGRMVQLGMNNAARATMRPMPPPRMARSLGDSKSAVVASTGTSGISGV